jgi:phosphomannomutase
MCFDRRNWHSYWLVNFKIHQYNSGCNNPTLGEEYTLAIAVEFILGHSQKRGPVCKNLSSSRAVDDIASKYGCQVYSTPVGEIHVCQLATHFAT